MADNTPFSVRMENSDKEKLLQLIQESGKSNKEFMQTLLSAYELNRAKIDVPEIAEDLKGLEALTQQINNYYVNIGKRIVNIEESKNLQFTKEIDLYKHKIDTLQEKTDKLIEQSEYSSNRLREETALKQELSKQVEQLTGTLESNKALITEYKEKNDTLTGLVNEYKAFKDENVQLKENLNKANLTNIQLNNEKISKSKEVDRLKEDISNLSLTIEDLKKQNREEREELNNKLKSDIDNIKAQHKEEIEKITQDVSKLKDAEKREEILKLKEAHQDKILTIQNEYLTKINEYQDKYGSLLQELEHMKAIKKA